jgi:hypothetical protein
MVLLQETYGALLVLTRNSSAPCIDYYVLLHLHQARHTVLLFYYTVATLVIRVRLDHWKYNKIIIICLNANTKFL